MRIKNTGTLLCSVAFTCLVPPANAEDKPALEEIVVTTQKRAQNLNDVPISVTALTADTLKDANVTLIEQLPLLTPGLSVSSSTSQIGVYLRGVGSRYTAPGLEPSVGTYVDDIYSPRASIAILDETDINRVEVLKGPQGTLYGRNTSGGAIRIITNDPTNINEGTVGLTYGRFNEIRTEGVANVALNDQLASRFAVTYVNYDGYTEGPVAGHKWNDRDSIRATGKLLYKPTDQLSIKLTGGYSHKADFGGQGPLSNDVGASGLRNTGVALGGLASPNLETSMSDYPRTSDKQLKYDDYSGSLRIDYQLTGVTLSSISTYQDFGYKGAVDIDASSLNYLVFNAPVNSTKTYSQELQAVSSGSGPLTWAAGLYYDHEKSRNVAQIFGGAIVGVLSPQLAIASYHQYVKNPQDQLVYIDSTADFVGESFAPYMQASYAFTDQWSMTLGGRYTYERKKIPLHTADLVFPTRATEVELLNEDRAATFKKFTPKAGVEFRPVNKVMLYASFSRGFKSGGFNNELEAPDEQLKPEILDAYEIGWKTEFERVRFNGAVYYYDWKDIQIGRSNGVDGATVENAASAQIFGLEADVLWAVTDRFELALSGAYTHGKFEDFAGDELTPNDVSAGCLAAAGGVIPKPGPTVPEACIGYATIPDVQQAGEPTPLTPKFTGNARAKYRFPLPGAMGELAPYAILSYSDKFNWGAGPSFGTEGSHLFLSAGINWMSQSGKYELSASGDNLTDEKYISFLSASESGGAAYPGAPRWWYVRGMVHF